MAEVKQKCKKCGREFLVISQEQKFLREQNLPFPENCPSCRQQRRLSLRGTRQLFKTKCQQCGKDIIVSYNPEKVKSKILCQSCYHKYMEETDLLIKE